jgi:hypothetical protein
MLGQVQSFRPASDLGVMRKGRWADGVLYSLSSRLLAMHYLEEYGICKSGNEKRLLPHREITNYSIMKSGYSQI